jgi:amino acid transporter
VGALKRFLLGRPLASDEAEHQLLPKILALPIFASDALSSNAYATEEILIVLSAAGAGVFHVSIPIALAVAALLVIVVTSYRQTVKAYPTGGGSYIVTKENLGTTQGLVAAAALLTDYVLTVAVSIAAGAFAIASLVPRLLHHRVALSLAFIGLVTVLNLRGLKESGLLFAIPTYGFVLSVLLMLVVGFARCTFGEHCPQAETAHETVKMTQTLGLFLILRAFSSGATALTGVEAIADGVAAFRGRRPVEQARNAASTLALLGVLSITMFVGITILAHGMNTRPSEHISIVGQIAHATFGGGFGFGVVQIMTALILVLAANTAYQDFPRLSSILAKDRFMPRQFINRGDRLVFSNGVLVLATLASILIIIYNAEVTRLIQLYVVGVFTSFTLSQTSMVLRWKRLRPPNWQRKAIVNAVGAVTTGVVLIVVALTKFTHGAWIVIGAVPLIVMGFKAINRHYASVATQLRRPESRPRMLRGTRVVVLVAKVNAASMVALGYARALRPLEVRALHVGGGEEAMMIKAAWEERRLPVPLEILSGNPDDIIDPVRSFIRSMERADDEVITAVVPEVFHRGGLRQLLRGRKTLLLKAALLFERNVVLTDVPVPAAAITETTRGTIAPTRVIATVLIPACHNATLRALEYARSLSPTELRAVHFNVDVDATTSVLNEWSSVVDDIPLEVIDSPYREVARPLLRYVRQIRRDTPDALVSVIVPEFVVARWWHQFLHNQTALAIKNSLQFEPGVVLTSVPFHLGRDVERKRRVRGEKAT